MRFCHVVNRSTFLACLLLLIFAGGCVRMTHPVLKDEQVGSNDALLGKWVSRDGKVSAELKPGNAGKYKLAYTNEDGKTGNFLVRFGKIGDIAVAEVSADAFPDSASGEFKSLLQPLYMMVVIQKADPLTLTSISTDWLKKFAQAHPDEVEVNNADDLIIQSSTDDFQALFLRHVKDNGMLGDPTIFVHPGDPTTQPAAH